MKNDLRQSLEFAESIINTVREPLIALDQDLRVVSANSSFYRVFQVNPNETVGQLIYDLGNKQWDIPKLKELLETILPERTSFDDYDVEHDFATIGWRTMLLNARQIKQAWNEERIILLAIEDITERRQLEETLGESEHRYRRLFETASDGIVLLDHHDGRIAHANPAIEKILGYSEAECLGKELRDIGIFIDTDDFSTILQALDTEGILNYEYIPLKSKTGQEVYSDIYMVNEAELVQCNIRDVGERKKLQTQLRQSQKMEVVGTLVGGIAHDFNNILNVIIGYGEIVFDTMAAESPERESMSEVLFAAGRAVELTRALLTFSRKEIGKVMPVNVNTLVLDLEKMLARIVKEDIEIQLDLSETPLIALTDSGQLGQVVINLASNAKDAMLEGGRLTITTGRVNVDEEFVAVNGYGEPGRYALITITDTGHGMDAETRTKIFEPFYTTKSADEGTGLGLAISYGIIDQHNGYIHVDSELDKGSIFKVYLPLCDEAVLKEESVVSIPMSGGLETILLAEDDGALRNLSKVILESFGYTVITAEDGEAAVSKFLDNQERIDLVLLDMIMPKKNGKAVAVEIVNACPNMKILYTSGYAGEFITYKGVLKDGDDLLPKPYTPRSLLLKIRETLDKDALPGK